MLRSACLTASLMMLSGMLTGLAAPLEAAEPVRTPNVVLMIGDDQGYRDFGFMGSTAIRTPHLDRLAAQGATFPRGYVPSSLCRPSLASLITGLYPHQHRISGNDPPKGTDRAEMLRHVRSWNTLPRWLAERGYVSFQSGKWWEGAPQLAGFTDGMTHGDPARGGRHGDEGLKIGRQGLQPIVDFLDRHSGKPFFLWYAPMLPHQPHNPPEAFLNKALAEGKSEHVARYEAMCEWFDDTCGQLLTELDRRQLTDRTLVIYVTDNGWIQDPEAAKFAARSKRSPYEGGLRTPIILRWPGRIAPGRHETLVSSLDLAPTILAACDLAPPANLPGIDLRKVIAAGASDRTALFGEIFDHDVADVDVPARSLQFRWCRTGDWKLIVPHDAAMPPELYNVSIDPDETRNVAAGHEELVQVLRGRINGWWTPE